MIEKATLAELKSIAAAAATTVAVAAFMRIPLPVEQSTAMQVLIGRVLWCVSAVAVPFFYVFSSQGLSSLKHDWRSVFPQAPYSPSLQLVLWVLGLIGVYLASARWLWLYPSPEMYVFMAILTTVTYGKGLLSATSRLLQR